MVTDWRSVAIKIGSLQSNDSEYGGDNYGRAALEEILGEEWIRSTVDFVISYRPGGEVATNSLCLLRSEKAAIYAYGIYKSSTGERADRAVWLIKQLAHPISIQWVEEFLNDPNVIGRGLSVLDQLLWSNQITYDESAEKLLQLALVKSEGQLAERVTFIHNYLENRKRPD